MAYSADGYPVLKKGELWVFDGRGIAAERPVCTLTRPTVQHGRFVRQTGMGLFGWVVCAVEPIAGSDQIVFVNGVTPDVVWPELVPAVIEGVIDAAVAKRIEKGLAPLLGIRVMLLDGQTHAVDSQPMAFRLAARLCVDRAVGAAGVEPLTVSPQRVPAPVPDVDQAFEAYQQSTLIALEELIEGGLRPVLEAHGFEERRPEIFCRAVNDVLQVVYWRYSAPRLWSSVNLILGVGIPALTEALGRGDLLDDVGHYQSLFARQRLRGMQWGAGEWWSLDMTVDLVEKAAELASAFEVYGLSHFEQLELQSSLDMVEAVLSGNELIHMGVSAQALVLALNGERTAALEIIAGKLAEWESETRHRWMVKPLLEAREYIERHL